MTDVPPYLPVVQEEVLEEVYADHVVLRPPNRLKERVTVRIDPLRPTRELDPIQRAEHALSLLSAEFGQWMRVEAEALEDAREIAAGRRDRASLAELFRIAHDMRGQAATFGYPFAGEIADGLCALFERLGDKAPPQSLIDRHVEAIRAIVREGARGRDNMVGAALAARLSDLRGAIAPWPNDA